MQHGIYFCTSFAQETQPAAPWFWAEKMIFLTAHTTPISHIFVFSCPASLPSRITTDCTIQTRAREDKNKNALGRKTEGWKVMAGFGTAQSRRAGEEDRNMHNPHRWADIVAGLFFSLPSVSFPQLQPLPCLCCQYELTKGNTDNYTSWDWEVSSRQLSTSVLG